VAADLCSRIVVVSCDSHGLLVRVLVPTRFWAVSLTIEENVFQAVSTSHLGDDQERRICSVWIRLEDRVVREASYINWYSSCLVSLPLQDWDAQFSV